MTPEPPGNGDLPVRRERLHIRRVRDDVVAIRHVPGESFRYWVVPDWLKDLFEVDP